MKEKKPIKTVWRNFRFTVEDAQKLDNLCRLSSSSSLSDYARNVLLQQPVSINLRNKSLDDFLTDMTRMRKDLNSIGNNFNQAVHRLHTLQSVPEIRQWLLINEQDKNRVLQLIETISSQLQASYNLWLHASIPPKK